MICSIVYNVIVIFKFQYLKKVPSKIDGAIEQEKAFLAKELQLLEDEYPGVLRGEQPVRAMVATTWRSGSTFLGDIMTAHPGTFYHYEPLLHYDIVQVRDGALAEDAVRTLKDLMHCNYTKLGKLKYE